MLKKILIIGFSILVLLLASTSTIIYLNKETIKDKALTVLNEQLNTEIIVNGKIDITFLTTFPHVSLQLEDIYIPDPYLEKDTLAFLEKINCTLAPLDLLSKNYTIDAISTTNGFLRLRINDDGTNNFDILKKDTTTSNSKNAAIHLEKISIENVQLNFDDAKDNIVFDGYLSEAIFKGSFVDKDFEIATFLDITAQELTVNEMTFLQGHNVKGETQLNYTGASQCINFLKNELTIQDNVFTINGNICILDNTIDLQATSKGGELENAVKLIPKSVLDFGDIKGKGSYNIEATINGNLSKPTIEFDFMMGNGTIELSQPDITLTNINANGAFHNKDKASGSILLHDFSLQSGESYLKGSISMPDLSTIKAEILLDGTIDYTTMNNIITNDVALTQGNVTIENGLIDFVYRNDSSWIVSQMDGIYTIADIHGNIESIDKNFELSANIHSSKNKASFSPASVAIGENNFSYTGELKNFLSYFQKDIFGNTSPLGINGEISSTHFDLNDFIVENNKKDDTEKEKDALARWLNATGSIKGNFDNFSYQNLALNDIALSLSSTKAGAIDIKLHKAVGLDGDLDGVIQVFFQEDEDIELTLTTNIRYIAIEQLFSAFNNFGQEGLTSDNIKGILSSKLMISAIFDKTGMLKAEDLLLDADIEIEDGELISLDMLMSLSKYLTVEQLEHLFFTDLKASVSIQDEIIRLPMTTIQSNLLTLDVGGTHTFDNQIDYTLKLNLKNLLAAKFKKNKTTEENYINDAEGGINLFISMTGDMDDPAIYLDKEKKKEWRKEGWKEEKEELKDLFKKEEQEDVEATDHLYFEEDTTEYIDWE